MLEVVAVDYQGKRDSRRREIAAAAEEVSGLDCSVMWIYHSSSRAVSSQCHLDEAACKRM